jgi:hypothetical protein
VTRTPLWPIHSYMVFPLLSQCQFLTFFTIPVKPWLTKKNPSNYILLLFLKIEYKQHLHQTERSTYSWAFCITFLKFTILWPQIENGTTLSLLNALRCINIYSSYGVGWMPNLHPFRFPNSCPLYNSHLTRGWESTSVLAYCCRHKYNILMRKKGAFRRISL